MFNYSRSTMNCSVCLMFNCSRSTMNCSVWLGLMLNYSRSTMNCSVCLMLNCSRSTMNCSVWLGLMLNCSRSTMNCSVWFVYPVRTGKVCVPAYPLFNPKPLPPNLPTNKQNILRKGHLEYPLNALKGLYA